MADTPSPLANLSSFPKTHFSPQIPCAHARQTFFFFRTTLWGVAGTEKHTNTLWPSSMWPAVLKRLNCWPPKNRLRCQALFRKFTNADLWNGHSFCKWILDANLLVLSPRRSKNTHQTFEAGIPSSAVVRYLYQPGELEGGRKRASDPIWNCTTSKKTITNPKWTDFVLFAERPQAWVCLRGSSCRACRHRAAASLMASPTAPAPTSSPPCDTLSAPSGCRPPEPAFVIVRAQPQLFLLIGAHHSFVYSQPSVCGGIYVPLQRFIALVQFVLSFLHRFWGRFHLGFFVLSVITLAAQGNHASALKLELKHPGFAFNPFGPSKPFFFSIFETPPATPGALLLSTNHMITQNTNCQYFVQPCACFPWLSPQTA